ncbi:MAG: hypothetical protein R3A80_04175 [Bdellovibrionota bacterium]
MIRHGYVHCASCHFNPAGGGVLTPYGKSLSSEVLSTWSYKGEERVLQGALSKNASSWVQGEKESSFIVGGDLRYIQVHQESSSVRRRKWFLMQADAELGAKWKNLLFLTTFGQEKTANTDRYRFRKTAVVATVNESATLKVGRAHPNLGLMVSEHFLSSRSDSGLGPLEYKDLAEVQANFETFGIVAGVEQSPYELRSQSNAERGFYLQGEYIVENYKFGVHYWNRRADTFSKDRYGAHALLGLSKRWALLTDGQFQQQLQSGSPRTWGLFASTKLTYEPFQGLWVSAWLDYSQRDLDDNGTSRQRFGPGFQFFPRPHMELQAIWLKENNKSTGQWGDYALLTLHYYL